MMKIFGIFMIVGVIAVSEISAGAIGGMSQYIECQSAEDCRQGECCVLGPNAYALPQCSPMLDEGDGCRPTGSGPYSRSLYYPNGEHIELTSVYHIMCPCTHGLSCQIKDHQATCRDLSQETNFNHLESEENMQDD